MPTENTSPANDPLGDPALRRALMDFVRRRVPSAEVDDVVQTVLVEALAAPNRPRDATELKRWLLGIARHKVVDLHRRATREPPTELPDIEAAPPPLEARSLAAWAEEQAGSEGDAQRTLAWMAREGEGEKLEAIAAEEQVPAARVRQRVSRMRRWMKERWTAELAAVAMLALLAVAAWWLLKREQPTTNKGPDVAPTIEPEPPSPLERGQRMRAEALRACDRSAWQECLDGLDKARGLDPEGDGTPAVGAARKQAQDALRGVPPNVDDGGAYREPSTTKGPPPILTATPARTNDVKSAEPDPSVPVTKGGKKGKPMAPKQETTPGTGKPSGFFEDGKKNSKIRASKKVLDSTAY